MDRSSMIDLPLDDIIEINNSGRKRPRPAESQRFLGEPVPVRPASYFPAPYPYNGLSPVTRMPLPMALPGGDSGEGTKVYISNLDYGVSNEDIKLLFSDVGLLTRYGIHCDGSGKSMGTAEVVFFHPEDAIVSVRRYNDACLDGKPMKLELVGTNLVTPNYPYTQPYRAPVGEQRQLMTTQGHDFNIVRGTPQGGGGRRRLQSVKPTAEDLDADLERHRSKAVTAPKPTEGS